MILERFFIPCRQHRFFDSIENSQQSIALLLTQEVIAHDIILIWNVNSYKIGCSQLKIIILLLTVK